MNLLKYLFTLLCVLGLWTTSTKAEGRVALVIGNASYSNAPVLANPANDANAIGAALERLGFDVTLGLDQSNTEFRDVIYQFTRKAEGADLALFFYAGHGIQVAGKNYLLPTDTALESETDLDFAAIDLQLVLRQLERVAANSIVLLDACRDNPFETALSRSMGATRSASALSRGLAPVDYRRGALIGFATDPGAVAFDGEGQHSPFTQALLSHIETPGLEINSMMTRVRADVDTATDGRQRPWAASSLLQEIHLAAAKDLPEASQNQTNEPAPKTDTITTAAPRASPKPAETKDTASPPDTYGMVSLQPVPAGRFNMGSNAHADERPVTDVALPGFSMSQTEITVGQYRQFIDQSDHRPAQGCYVWTETGRMRFRESANWSNPGFPVSDEMPAACVNWRDAQAYADWFGATYGKKSRLPSEAELEYVIRAGSTGEHPFKGGAEAVCDGVNAADASSGFKWRNTACEDGFPRVAEVTALQPNVFGLTGTTGNLWEWAADCWNPSHSGARGDGKARTSGQCESRVLRGGSWDDPLDNLRSSYRVGIPANRRQANVGFRIVVEP